MPEGRLQRTREIYERPAKDGYCVCGLRAEEGTDFCRSCHASLAAMRGEVDEPTEETPWAV